MPTHDGPTEIWFHTHPWTTTDELTRLFQDKQITATPRFGRRNSIHPKGYWDGQRVTLKVLDPADEQEILTADAEVTDLTIRPLLHITPTDLDGCEPACREGRDAGRILSHFEGRIIQPEEVITIVRFAYRGDIRHTRR